ncbi:MAG: biotin/lipoyl-binding protein [Anaerolineae bacterium]|nr:MAG: biotin/lipoyl-binding protein [Anaerolineae bacterium]
MKYLARVKNQGFQVTVEDDGQVVVGDRAFSVDLKSIDEGALFSLLIDHESYELVVDEGQDGYRLLLWGETYEVAVEDAQPRQVKTRKPLSPASSGDECVVRAPMPGLVVQVPVSAGQEVSAGEVLVVLESMKMENELLAPRQGIVKAIHVAAGDTSRLDEPLVTLM